MIGVIKEQEVEMRSDNIRLKGNLVLTDKIKSAAALFLHGAGLSSIELYRDWQHNLAKEGIASLAFDCRGVGESSGKFEEGSLNNRLRDTETALEFLLRKKIDKSRLAVIGGSMGGHVAARLVENHPHIKAIILTGAAAYGKEAEDKPLNNEFSETIRKENSWSSSPVFNILEKYKGRLFVVYGEGDNVIPEGVKAKYKMLVGSRGEYVIIKNGGHKLLRPSNSVEEIAKQELFNRTLEFLKGCGF